MPTALEALGVIEEWNGDLADASESIAKRNGIEGVEDKADLRWFFQNLEACQTFVCQAKYESLREGYISVLITALTEFLAKLMGCPPGIASIIATPFAIYISQEGIEKFCRQSFRS